MEFLMNEKKGKHPTEEKEAKKGKNRVRQKQINVFLSSVCFMLRFSYTFKQ